MSICPGAASGECQLPVHPKPLPSHGLDLQEGRRTVEAIGDDCSPFLYLWDNQQIFPGAATPLNLWLSLKTPDFGVQISPDSGLLWWLIVGGAMVLTVILPRSNTFGNSIEVLYALDGILPLRMRSFCSLTVGETRVTEGLNSLIT